MNYFLPLLIVIASNSVYHIISKQTPGNVNTFLSLFITYLVGAVVSLAVFFITSGQSFTAELHKLNWTSYALGICIIGLESGFLYMYRVGWKISIGSLVANIAVSLVLLVIGILFYKDSLNLKQIIGILLCTGGLVFMNL